MGALIKREKLPCPSCSSKWTYWRVWAKHYICRACGNEFEPYDNDNKKEIADATNISNE